MIFRQAIITWCIEARSRILQHWRSWFIQQMDLLELYNWLTETESTVMTECHASRGVASAKAAIKKHSVVESIVTNFQAPRLRNLSECFFTIQKNSDFSQFINYLFSFVINP